jgi:hypothetical protein
LFVGKAMWPNELAALSLPTKEMSNGPRTSKISDSEKYSMSPTQSQII